MLYYLKNKRLSWKPQLWLWMHLRRWHSRRHKWDYSKANVQQSPTSSEFQTKTERNCDLDSCNSRKWQLSAGSKSKKWTILALVHCLPSVTSYLNLIVMVVTLSNNQSMVTRIYYDSDTLGIILKQVTLKRTLWFQATFQNLLQLTISKIMRNNAVTRKKLPMLNKYLPKEWIDWS